MVDSACVQRTRRMAQMIIRNTHVSSIYYIPWPHKLSCKCGARSGLAQLCTKVGNLMNIAHQSDWEGQSSGPTGTKTYLLSSEKEVAMAKIDPPIFVHFGRLRLYWNYVNAGIRIVYGYALRLRRNAELVWSSSPFTREEGSGNIAILDL